MLHGNRLCVGTQAVALASHNRVIDVVVDDDKEELGLCMKLASAIYSILERQMLMTDKEEEHRKMLKMTETLCHMVNEIRMLTSQPGPVCNSQEEEEHTNGKFILLKFI